MDTFNILLRGTKARTPSSVKTVLPSAPKGPQLHYFGQSQKKDERDPTSGKDHARQPKRKRDTYPSERPEDIRLGDDHDFPLAKSKTQSEWEEGQELRKEYGFSLSREECRQMLHDHRLKIVQLYSPLSSNECDTEPRTKKRKRNQLVEGHKNRANNHRKEIISQPLRSFSELRTRHDVAPTICSNLASQGFASPTEVQLGALPLLLHESPGKGKTEIDGDGLSRERKPTYATNLLTIAPTGSGKTLAFLIPIMNYILQERRQLNLQKSSNGPLAVILAPTKELARQTVNEARKLAVHTNIAVTLIQRGMRVPSKADRCAPELRSYNGNPKTSADHSQVTKADILVSTPLALLHAMQAEEQKVLALPSVGYLVLDEADVLLDPLFRDQTMNVWSACTSRGLCVTLWSATMGSNVEDLAMSKIQQNWLATPEHLEQSSEPRPQLLRLVVGLKDSSIPNIEHKLVYAANERGKLLGLRQLLHSSSALTGIGVSIRPPLLVFTQTIPRAIALHSELMYDMPGEAGGSCRIAVLHSDLSDAKRDHIMMRFRKGELWVLITTDLLARGVDFKGVNGVVNYDLPTSSAAYVHRAGRTGRAGREGGIAVTLYAKEDLPYVKNVANVIAASERQKSGHDPVEAAQSWFLDLLPKVAKKDRQRLKKRGVEARRTPGLRMERGDNVNLKARISTKSAYDRRMENKKLGARNASKGRIVVPDSPQSDGSEVVPSEDKFTSFED